MIKNKKFALWFRLFAFVLSILGIVVHLRIYLFEFKVASLMYYTIQSNILAIVMFSILLYKTIKDYQVNKEDSNCSYMPRFEFVVMIDLLLTMIVYWVLLAPTAFKMTGENSLFSFSNLTLHLFVPLLCLIDYFIFTKSKQVNYKDIYLTVLFPLFYLIFTSIAGVFGYVYASVSNPNRIVHYPYFFMDYDIYGVMTIVNILVMTAIFLLLGHLVYFIDSKLKRG